MLKSKTIIVGVTGGIAAYKTAAIVSNLKNLGADVWVVMTKEAAQFVGPLTFKTLSGNPVTLDLFSQETINAPVPHISLAEKADLILIAPCTANIIGKIANGIADDPLTTIVMASRAKKLMAPAMNCNMWNNSAVQENLKKLNDWHFVGPVEGKLACGVEDIGRMAGPEEIINKAVELLVINRDLAGKQVLVTAGGTREAIDPVRYISNRSSGKMGYAIAGAARERGAEVKLISANVDLPSPLDIKPVKVESAAEMQKAVEENFEKTDILIMAAAVADYKPKIQNPKSKTTPKSKIKKDKNKLKLILQPTEDILEGLGKDKTRPGKIIIGFALETDNLVANAKKKLKEKNLDLIVVNGPASFGSDSAKVVLIDKRGKTKEFPLTKKADIANRILDFLPGLH